MEVRLILGSIAIVGAIATLWWGATARPSAARTNLMAGLPEPAPVATPLVSIMRQLGQTAQRLLPNAWVDGLGVKLVQAGHPQGLDLPRLLGIKVALATFAAFVFAINGQVLLAVITAAGLFFLPDYWVLSVRDKRQTQMEADVADIMDQLTICVEAGLGFDARARSGGDNDGGSPDRRAPAHDERHPHGCPAYSSAACVVGPSSGPRDPSAGDCSVAGPETRRADRGNAASPVR